MKQPKLITKSQLPINRCIVISYDRINEYGKYKGLLQIEIFKTSVLNNNQIKLYIYSAIIET